MDENEDMKKELRDLEEEIEEMQDNFRFRSFKAYIHMLWLFLWEGRILQPD